MKVLLVSDTKGKDDEGMKKIARMLYSELDKKTGIDVAIAAPREAPALADGFDLLHYIGGPSYRSALIASLLKIRKKISGGNLRIILSFTNPFWGWRGNLLMRICPPDHVIVLSDYWKSWAEKYKLNHSAAPLVGVDQDKFYPIDHTGYVALRKQLSLPEDKVVLLHVGHLKPDRNLGLLLKAQQSNKIQVVIVGSTTTKQSLSLVEELRSGGCIVLDTYQPQIEQYYQASDCYIFPTVDPKAAVQIPLSVLEALSTELPVVSTPFGGLPSLFQEEPGVHFFSEADVEKGRLAQIVIDAAKEKPNRNSTGLNTWDDVAQKLTKLYKEVLEN